MKKHSSLFLLLIFIFITGTSLAQKKNNEKKKIRTNFIEAGYNLSSMSSAGESIGSPKSGFYISLFKELRIIPGIRVGTGLSYIKNGSNLSDEKLQEYLQDGEFMANDECITLNYLTLPAHVTGKIGPFAGMIGISGSYRVAAKIIANGDKRSLNNKDYINMWDAAAFAGVRFNILFIGVDLRYNRGLTKVFDEYKNNYFQAGAFLTF